MRKKKIEQVTTYGGNGQAITRELPKLVFYGHMNDVALEHVRHCTGLELEVTHSGYTAQPTTADQVVRLLLTYNFKTRYFDNWDHRNELHLKNDHHVGFDVDSICFMCARENRIPVNGLAPHERLAA